MGAEPKAWRKNPGLIASCGVHVCGFIFLIANFSHPPKIEDAIETIPVEMVSASDVNDITNGEKTAKPLPTPQRRVDKVAEIEDHKPLPPTPTAVKDTPPLPSPDKNNDDPGHADKPAEQAAAAPPPVPQPRPTPPVPAAQPPAPADTPMPPDRPRDVAPKAEQAKAEPASPDEDKPDAEVTAPKPPPRPKTPVKEAKAEVTPPPRPHQPDKVAKVPPAPPKRPEAEQKPEPKPEKKSIVDQVANLLDKLKPTKPVEKPRSGNEVADARPHDDFSIDKISALLDHDAPQRKQSTGRALTQMASLGSPTAHAEKLSPSMAAQLDGWLIDHYRGCWSYFGLGGTKDYVPQLRIRMAQDGSLIGQPALLNPPNDPNLKSLADSAIRAVNRCNPLEIPARFRPYYDEGYRQRVVRFDPKEMS